MKIILPIIISIIVYGIVISTLIYTKNDILQMLIVIAGITYTLVLFDIIFGITA